MHPSSPRCENIILNTYIIRLQRLYQLLTNCMAPFLFSPSPLLITSTVAALAIMQENISFHWFCKHQKRRKGWESFIQNWKLSYNFLLLFIELGAGPTASIIHMLLLMDSNQIEILQHQYFIISCKHVHHLVCRSMDASDPIEYDLV